MGLFDKIKRTFNVSGLKGEIVAFEEAHGQGGVVEGQVNILGGEYEQKGNSILLELQEFWTETRSSPSGVKGQMTTRTVTVRKTRESTYLDRDFTIGPEEAKVYSFELQLPLNSRISTRGTGWSLNLTVDIPGARDSRSALPLKIQPAPAILAIVAALESVLKFERRKGYPRWSAKTQNVSFRLDPSRMNKETIDHLDLILRQARDGIEGTLSFDLAEKSFKDYLKAIFNKDTIERPLALSMDEIFTPDGEARTEAIAEVVETELREIARERRKV